MNTGETPRRRNAAVTRAHGFGVSVWYAAAMVFACVGIGGTADAEDRTERPPASLASAASTQSAQAQTRSFDIPAGDLQSALTAFSRQTDLQLLYPADLTEGLRTEGVSGVFTAEQALKQLLAGTGLRSKSTGGNAVTLERMTANGDTGPARLEPITVEAILPGTLTESYNAPDSFAATRTDTPVIDTPQSIQSVTRQALEDAGATEIADSYDYLAGITRENNVGGVFGDDYIARGFATDNILFNGNRTGQPITLDTANVERIETLRGPTGTLFGRADPGGLINVVTKQPLAEPFHQVAVSGGTGFFGDGKRYRDARTTLDTGGPIDDDGRVRYRLNTAAEYEKSFREDIDKKLFFISPVVDVELDDKTVANVELTYQYRQDAFDRGVFFVEDELRLSPDFNIAEGQQPDIKKHYVSGAFRIDRALNDMLTARLGIYTSYNSFDGEGIQLGSLTGTTATAQRRLLDGHSVFVTVQPELVAEFPTGPVGHTVLFGVDASYQENKARLPFGPAGAPFDVFDPNFPVDAPTIDLSQPGSSVFARDLTAASIGVYVEDQLDLSEQWKLLVGLRWDGVRLTDKTSFFVNTGGPPLQSSADDDLTDSALLPRVGLVYQPIPQVGLYASYSETYRPPAAGGLTDSNGDPVKPEEGKNYEVGIKLEALNGRLGGTLSAFLADKKNVLEGDPVDFLSQVNVGKVRSQGVEFDLTGEVLENLSVGVTYAYTDATINSNANPNLPKGTRLRNVPRHAASLQAAYRFTDGALRGFRVFGGVVYEGDKPTDTSATITTKIPNHVRVDLGASYDLTKNVQASLLVRNVTNEEYYTTAAGRNNVAVGQPFNATAGVRVRF